MDDGDGNVDGEVDAKVERAANVIIASGQPPKTF
jgi:hypothetical protein